MNDLPDEPLPAPRPVPRDDRPPLAEPPDSLEALAAENRRLRELLAAAQAQGRLYMFERDGETGQGRWDPRLFELLGLPRQDGVPSLQALNARVEPADLEPFLAEVERGHREPGVHAARFRYRHPDGRRLWLHSIWHSPERGRRALGLIIDDTAVMERAEQHGLARQQLDMLSRLVGLFAWRRDYEDNRFYVNEDVWLTTGDRRQGAGLSRDEFLAMVHPDDHAEEVTPERGRTLGDTPLVTELRFRPPGQSGWRTMLTRRVVQRDADGRVRGMLGVGVDVTDQVRERERHRQLLERFDLLVETTGVGVWTWDLDSGEQEWSGAMRAIYGLSHADELPGASVPDGASNAVLPEDRDRVTQALRLAREDPSRRGEVAFRIRRPDGEVRHLVGRARCMDGETRTLSGIVLDVTETHRAEQALRDKEIAERADRAKSEFLSRVSHELRTPLNAVIGFSDLLLHDAAQPLGASQRERLKHVRAAGAHLLGLVDDLLEIGRHGATGGGGLGGASELAAVVAQVVAWLGPAALQAGVSLRVSGQAPAVVGGERHWRQIVSNLVSNGIKFNRRGGAVEIMLGEHGTPPWPTLIVRDDGRGLNDAQQQHLFEPFNRLGAERDGIPGTGLGLSIVRQLVQVLGGDVDVESRAGEGTTVRLRVPPAGRSAWWRAERAAPTGGTASRSAVASEAAFEGGTAAGSSDDAPSPLPDAAPAWARRDDSVVYVEDNPVNVMLVREILARRPETALHVAGTVAEALALVPRVRPQLLIVDMHLPDGDGLELLAQLRGSDGALPAAHCVVLSASVLPDEVARARDGGFEEHWAKPIDVAGFRAAVDRLLG